MLGLLKWNEHHWKTSHDARQTAVEKAKWELIFLIGAHRQIWQVFSWFRCLYSLFLYSFVRVFSIGRVTILFAASHFAVLWVCGSWSRLIIQQMLPEGEWSENRLWIKSNALFSRRVLVFHILRTAYCLNGIELQSVQLTCLFPDIQEKHYVWDLHLRQFLQWVRSLAHTFNVHLDFKYDIDVVLFNRPSDQSASAKLAPFPQASAKVYVNTKCKFLILRIEIHTFPTSQSIFRSFSDYYN